MEALQETHIVPLEDPLESVIIKSEITDSRSKINLLTQSIKTIYAKTRYRLSLKRFEYDWDYNNNDDQEEKIQHEYTSGSWINHYIMVSELKKIGLNPQKIGYGLPIETINCNINSYCEMFMMLFQIECFASQNNIKIDRDQVVQHWSENNLEEDQNTHMKGMYWSWKKIRRLLSDHVIYQMTANHNDVQPSSRQQQG